LGERRARAGRRVGAAPDRGAPTLDECRALDR